MSPNIEGREKLKNKEIKESINEDYSFVGLGDQNESEINWVKLHQMFDK
tara:strand:- start:548 stop:694 length:147 start_codon:yes stop_codon:yes gene_type:complete